MNAKKIDELWSHIYWLAMLAEMGSFTAAAERLGVSKAAMSQRIAELERAAGVPLVRRTTRSVRLTEAGQHLVATTRAAFADIARNFSEVRDLAGEPRGSLRVTAPVALGRQRIVPLIPEFLRNNPAVRIELELSDHLSSLAKEGFDLAIRHVATVPDTHVAWRLCGTHSVLVASRSYLKRRGAPLTPAELSQHDCIHYLRGTSTPTWAFERARGGSGRTTVEVSGPFAANNSEVLREAALAGLGIALLPDFSARDEVAAGKLAPLLDDWKPVGAFGDSLFAIRPYATHVPKAVTSFVTYLRKALKSGFV